jgi:transcriptional regulator with GAF, ATPase, and Fis domain
VDEITLDCKAKRLRALQKRKFERMGDDLSDKINVRIRVAAATNLDIEAAARAGKFCGDPGYR